MNPERHDVSRPGCTPFQYVSTTPFKQFGWAGVDLFFAISGILICSRLLEEERSAGK